jgi:serine protease Do
MTGRPMVTGAWVASVDPGSVAAAADVRPGDIVTSYNGQPIVSAADLSAAVGATSQGAVVTLIVRRAWGPVVLEAQF